MKRIIVVLILVALLALSANAVLADKPVATNESGEEVAWSATCSGCTKIQDGTLLTSAGDFIMTGYDQWGYNYQAHMFNGKYCDSYRDAPWCQAWADVNLIMKWNDAWLANVDCDSDSLLDRHFGFASYKGSGAWLTNHQSGTYPFEGRTCSWDGFTKIVAVPADATLVAGTWLAADGAEIGPVIWGEFAIIQDVYNDPCAGYDGLQYLSGDHAGFGGW